MRAPSVVCWLTDERVYAACGGRGRRQNGIVAEVECAVPNSLYSEHDPASLADAVLQAVQSLGGTQSSITLVIPLNWCFVHLLPLTSKRPGTESLSFEFEEHLPVSLEELTCAFMPLSAGRMLAAAVPTEPTHALLEAIESRGINVECLTVDAALYREIDPRANLVLNADVRWTRVVTRGDGTSSPTVAAFGSANGDSPESLFEQLRWRGIDGLGDHWLIIEATNDAATAGVTSKLPTDPDEAGTRITQRDAIETIVSRPMRVALDFRTGPLAGKSRREQVSTLARQCAVILSLLLMACAVGLYQRRATYARQIEAIDAARLAAYCTVFPDDALPPGAALRLASERIRLEGLTGKVATLADSSISPLAAMRELAAGLPADLRVMLLDARLDEKQLTLRGQTGEHRDAERLVEVLNRLSGVEARPPRTSRLESGGVEFSIVAVTASRQGELADGG